MCTAINISIKFMKQIQSNRSGAIVHSRKRREENGTLPSNIISTKTTRIRNRIRRIKSLEFIELHHFRREGVTFVISEQKWKNTFDFENSYVRFHANQLVRTMITVQL